MPDAWPDCRQPRLAFDAGATGFSGRADRAEGRGMKDMTPQQKLAALAEKWRKESERRGEDANNKGWAHWVRENNAGRSIALHSCADELTTLLSEHGGGGEADPVAVVQSVGGVYGVKWLGETVAHGTYLYDRTPPPQPRADIRGHLPAPITNPKAWPPNYADGWNDCARLALDGVTIALAAAPCEPVSNDYKYDDCPKCRKRGDDCGEHFPPDVTPPPASQPPSEGELLEQLEIAARIHDDMTGKGNAMAATIRLAATTIRRLAASGQVGEWQPIETAPRDGRRLLLVHRHGRPFVGYYQDGEGWLDAEEQYRDPTIWAAIPPLPATPTQQQEGR